MPLLSFLNVKFQLFLCAKILLTTGHIKISSFTSYFLKLLVLIGCTFHGGFINIFEWFWVIFLTLFAFT